MRTPAQQFEEAAKRHSFALTTEFAASFDFPFDSFQVQGCRAIESGKGVLVAAPTGAGKTVIGEFAAFTAIKQDRKCFYTTPIKALSNQKYQEFVDRFGSERVGLLTGDTSINGEAQILVMTTEVLRNMLYAGSSTLSRLGFVVMDEVHYLADKFRGAVWEEVLIHLMESVQVISLSATVSNAEEFGEWLQTIRGDTEIIVSEIRPVPLYQHVLIDNSLIDLFVENGRVNPEILRRERESLRRVHSPREHGRHRDWSEVGRKNARAENWSEGARRLSRWEIIEKLQRQSMLPAITFIFSRLGCDSAVRQCLASPLKLTTSEERLEIRATAQKYTENIAQEDLETLGFHEWISGLERGIAAHHAGLLPSFKSAVEELFQRGLLKAIFATETLALGINMPARTVVLEKLDKWNGEAHVAITPGEYTQLTGRAGRRGIDIEGNAVVQWSPTVDSATAAGLASTRTYPLKSSFSPTYNMAINLISQLGRQRARHSLESSFAQFQADRAVVGLTRQIQKNERAIADFTTNAECHLGDFAEYARFRREIRATETLLSKRQAKKGFDQKQRAHLERELIDLRKGMRNHPCHSCDEREDHARQAERGDRLVRENIGLLSRVENRTHVIARTFDRICDVLTELGYIEGEKTLPQGKILAKVYTESDLLLTEAIAAHLFDRLSASELASVVSSVIFQGRSGANQSPRIPTTKVQMALADVVRLWTKLEVLEQEHEVKTQREPDFGFCWISFRWANGHSLQSVLRDSDLSVGDFVRSTKQLIDLLQQISIASENLRPKCLEAIKRLDRGVVAYFASEA